MELNFLDKLFIYLSPFRGRRWQMLADEKRVSSMPHQERGFNS